jgi:hypothetical protein
MTFRSTGMEAPKKAVSILPVDSYQPNAMKITQAERWDDPEDATCIVCHMPTIGWAQTDRMSGVRWVVLPCGCCNQTDTPHAIPDDMIAVALLMLEGA